MAKPRKKRKPVKKTTPPLTKEKKIEIAKQVVPIMLKGRGVGREGAYFMYRAFDLPQVVCEQLAGYAEGVGTRLEKRYKESPEVRSRIDNLDFLGGYRKLLRSWLPDMARIDSGIINEYLNDPKLAIDKPQALKQLKQGAGVVFEPEAPKQQIIAIESLRIMQGMIGGDLQETLEGEIIQPKQIKDK